VGILEDRIRQFQSNVAGPAARRLSDERSAQAAAMSEEQFTDSFKRQVQARDAKLMAKAAPPAQPDFSRDPVLDASIQQDFKDSMRPAPPAAPPSPETAAQRSDRMSAEAASMSEEQFTDAFKRQLVARDSQLAEQQFTDKFKRGLVKRDAKLTEEANANAMIDRIRAARQTGIGDAPQLSALAQQMMYLRDGSKRPLPSQEMLDKWAGIDAQAGRKRQDGGHIAVPPSPPRMASIAAAPAKPAAVATPADDEEAGPLPPIPAQPVGLQAPEAPKPADAAVERPAMVPMDAAVNPEPARVGGVPRNTARYLSLRELHPSVIPHYEEAARQLGFDLRDKIAPTDIGNIRRRAHAMRDAATAQQWNDRQSDRNQSREQNVPMALATAQRLQGRGRALLAQAGGLDDADPRKPALQAQGEQMLSQGNSQHAAFMGAWERQSSQQIDQSVMQAAMMFGRAGAGIVESHLRGQQEMARARLNDQGQRDDRLAAENGLNNRAKDDNNVRLAVAGMNVTAQEIQQQRDREQRIAELKERERLHGLDQAQREKLAKDERDAAAHRQKLDLNDRQKGRDAQAAQNPVPMQPAEQQAQLHGPLKAADGNDDDETPVQQYVDNFRQTLAGQQGLNDTQREMQSQQSVSWANRHVMSRMERGKLRDSDKQYIRSMAYTKEGKLKDLSAFVREIGGSYGGSNWKAMAKQLAEFHKALAADEGEAGLDKKVTQVGIPDYPVV